jgi:hypothetical protein
MIYTNVHSEMAFCDLGKHKENESMTAKSEHESRIQ